MESVRDAAKAIAAAVLIVAAVYALHYVSGGDVTKHSVEAIAGLNAGCGCKATGGAAGRSTVEEVVNLGSITAYVSIYKNGEKVLEERDVATNILFKQIAFLLFKKRLEYLGGSFDTNPYIVVITNPFSPLYIELGSGTQAETPTVDELATRVAKLVIGPGEYEVSYLSNTVRINASVTWTATSSVTIREVGLSNNWGLLFYHVLSDPVALDENDSVTVVYRITIQRTLPFTENMWRLIVMHVFCSSYYEIFYQLTNTRGHTVDFVYPYVEYPQYERSVIKLATDIKTLSDDPLTVYNATMLDTRVSRVDVSVSGSLKVDIYGSFGAGPRTATVRGVVIYTTIRQPNAVYRDFITLYAPFPEPITLQPWQGLGYHLTFTVNAS